MKFINKYLPKATILELLRKCLVVCSHANKQLAHSAFILSRMLGNKFLNYKLAKLLSLSLNIPDLAVSTEVPLESNFDNFISLEKESLDVAAKSLELIKHGRKKSKTMKRTDVHAEVKTRWAIAKSWNPCPIGMLPHKLGSSGCLPVLDCCNVIPETSKLSNSKNQLELNQCLGNQEAQRVVEQLDYLSTEKTRETVVGCEVSNKENISSQGIKGNLLIDGVWRRVTEDEVIAIASGIRILV